ncbi:MAG: aminotransferase class V-fold PLP-dependent enzyme [Planctomycetes bacterium]|nr:aminotransferase class V-fold PLP-dependent enzyme [Planctomycetota bacterium]
MTTPPALRNHWTLDPAVTFLNHGSFGACPRTVLEAQSRYRAQMEAEPVRFMVRELEPALDDARGAVARFVGADSADLAFVPNATTGVNTVLRSLAFAAGDELLTTDHVYNACGNVLRFVAERSGARVVVAPVPFPIAAPDDVADVLLRHVTPRTKLLLIDHITSATGIVLPIRRIVEDFASRGIEVLVDGAHGPGMVPLDLRSLGDAGMSYYTGNFHKWVCAPKGAAMLWVRRDRQAGIRPLTISHGTNSPRTERSRFRLEFDWGGTDDPTPFLCVPDAIRFMDALFPGGWPEVMRRNRAMTLTMRRKLAARLGTELPCPDDMIGSLATIPLPGPCASSGGRPLTADYGTDLQIALADRHRIQVPIIEWFTPVRRFVRISAQVYNTEAEYDRLGDALMAELPG